MSKIKCLVCGNDLVKLYEDGRISNLLGTEYCCSLFSLANNSQHYYVGFDDNNNLTFETAYFPFGLVVYDDKNGNFRVDCYTIIDNNHIIGNQIGLIPKELRQNEEKFLHEINRYKMLIAFI